MTNMQLPKIVFNNLKLIYGNLIVYHFDFLKHFLLDMMEDFCNMPSYFQQPLKEGTDQLPSSGEK